jgi:hypothetical protein
VSEVDNAEQDPVPPLASAADGLGVRTAAELLEQARVDGVSLVGQGGLLQHVVAALQNVVSTLRAKYCGDKDDAPGSQGPHAGSAILALPPPTDAIPCSLVTIGLQHRDLEGINNGR